LFTEVGLLFAFHLVNRFRLHFTPLHALCNRHAKTVRFSHAFQKSGKKLGVRISCRRISKTKSEHRASGREPGSAKPVQLPFRRLPLGSPLP
jgi:hypothetical protein